MANRPHESAKGNRRGAIPPTISRVSIQHSDVCERIRSVGETLRVVLACGPSKLHSTPGEAMTTQHASCRGAIAFGGQPHKRLALAAYNTVSSGLHVTTTARGSHDTQNFWRRLQRGLAFHLPPDSATAKCRRGDHLFGRRRRVPLTTSAPSDGKPAAQAIPCTITSKRLRKRWLLPRRL